MTSHSDSAIASVAHDQYACQQWLPNRGMQLASATNY